MMKSIVLNKICLFVFLLTILSSCKQQIEEGISTLDSTAPIAIKDTASTTSQVPVVIDVALNDSDAGDNLDKSSVVLGISIGGTCSFAPASPMVEFLPDFGFKGTGSCFYTICDDESNCSNSVFEVEVADTNPPTILDDFLTTDMDSATSPFDVLANDSDAEGSIDVSSLSIPVAPLPVGGSCVVFGGGPFIVFTPDLNFTGDATCSYEVCDTETTPNCAIGTINVTVQDATAPLAVNDTTTTDTQTPANIDVSANDTDPGNNLDTTSVSVNFAVGGTCTVATSPTVNFTPQAGFLGTATCGYRICDTFSNCSDAVLAVTVTDATGPVALNDMASTTAGNPTSAFNVATNDTDAENQLDLTSVTILGSPASVGGSCAVSTSPSVVFTPTPGFIGLGSCPYQICDNSTNCTQALLEIQVSDANAPTAVNDTTSITSISPGVTVDVSGNDTDVENELDPSSVTISFSVGGTCSFDTVAPNVRYVPNAGFTGVGLCGYSICDNSNNCSTASLQVTVTDGGAPVTSPDFSDTLSSTPTNPINVAVNDSDPENLLDQSSVTILGAPAPVGGTCAVTTSPNVVFTPTGGFTGAASCTYQICDNAANCSPGTLNVTVTEENPPVITNDNATTLSGGSGVVTDVAANDTDAEGTVDTSSVTLTYMIGGVCTLDPASPNVRFTPNAGFIGSGSCGYRICDDSNNCGLGVLNVTVNDGQNPVTADDSTTTIADTDTQAINVSLNDSDPEDNLDLASVTILGAPAPVGGTCAVGTSPSIIFSPTTSYTGPGSCTYQICDNASNCSTGTLNVTVNDSSFPQVINDSLTVNSGSSGGVVDVSANDVDGQGNLDTSSVTLSFAVGGTCAIETASPDVRFTPTAGFIGNGSCGYQICDLTSNCATGVIQATVVDAGNPVASGDTISTNSGLASTDYDVTINDVDAENNLDTASVTILGAPAPVGGSCAVTSSPLVHFTPNPGFFGVGSCTYQVCDKAANCDTATITVNVNDASTPIAVSDTGSMDSSTALLNVDVLANDSDPEGDLDATTLSIQSSSGGTCTVNTGTVDFAPNSGFIGNANCSYQICDTTTNCATASIAITVTDGVDPVASSDSITVATGSTSAEVNVSSNDIDAEANLDFASVTILGAPAPVGGTCAVTNSPMVQFNATPGFLGAGSCTYQICDKAGNCGSAVLNATVNDVNAPVAVADSTTMSSGSANVSYDVLANDSDAESNMDTSSLSVVASSGGTCTASTPNIIFTPNSGFIGNGSCSYQICDNASNCSSASMSVSVADSVAPVASNDSVTVGSGLASVEVNVLANDTDAENNLDPSSLTVLGAPAPVGGSCVVGIASPLIQFISNSGFLGAGSCTYQICDKAANCDTAVLLANVTDINSPNAVDDTSFISTNASGVTFDVLANDTDPENNLDPTSLTTGFANGGTCVAASPNITFTTTSGFAGNAFCNYDICDNAGNCDSAVFNIIVQDSTGPIANTDFATTSSGVPTGAINVASNDFDLSSSVDLTSVTAIGSPIGGTCAVSSSPFIIFTPTPGFTGAGQCNYNICDMESNCSSGLIEITVTDDTAPTAVADSVSTNQNVTAAPVDVSANDSDPETNLDPSTVTLVVGSEANGTCAVAAPNITFTPDTDFAGLGSCGYEICDSEGNCAQSALSITVNDVTQPTVIINQASVQADPTNALPVIFDVQFSEPINPTSFGVSDINTSLNTTTGGIYSIINAGNDKDFSIFVYALTSEGDVTLSLDAGVVLDKNGLATLASTSTDNTVSYNPSAPSPGEISTWTWTIASPSNGTISQDGTPEITLAGGGAENGGTVAIYDDSFCLSQRGSSQTIVGGGVLVSDINYLTNGTDDGVKTFFTKVTDTVGNVSTCTPISLGYTLDNISPDVSINQASTQLDPTLTQPVVFTVVFSEPIDPSTFEPADISQAGTASVGVWAIGPSSDNQIFSITANTMGSDGTIIPEIALGGVSDFAGNTNNAYTATDNTVVYDTTPPVVNIVSAPTINNTNEDVWPISGTCSEATRDVDIVLEPGNIPGNITPIGQVICQGDNTWSTTLDTRPITVDGEYTLQATHTDELNLSSTTQTPVFRQASCVPPDDISDLAAVNVTQQTLDLNWTIPADNGTAIFDYVVEYRNADAGDSWSVFPDGVSTSNVAAITSLSTSTTYEFRVRATQASGCTADFSNVVSALTKPNHPFFDSFDYELVNLSGAANSRVVALEDATTVDVFYTYATYDAETPDETYPMNKGDVVLLSSLPKGAIVQSVNPIYVSGRLTKGSSNSDGNPAWASPLWADKVLTANLTRDFPGEVNVYNFESGSDITLYAGETVLASATNVAADTIVTLTIPNTAPANVVKSFKLESNGFIFATIFGTGSGGNKVTDDMPFLPAAKELIGMPSRNGQLGTPSTTPVSFTVYHSDGGIDTTVYNETGGFPNNCEDTGNPLTAVSGAFTFIYPYKSGTKNCNYNSSSNFYYTTEAAYVIADGNVSANNTADGDGSNSAPFVPLFLKKRRYAIVCLATYLVFASDVPAVIEERDPANALIATHTLARTGAGPFDAKTPYKIRLTNVPMGHRFIGQSVGVDEYVGWVQCKPNASDPLGNQVGYMEDDETLLYGYD